MNKIIATALFLNNTVSTPSATETREKHIKEGNHKLKRWINYKINTIYIYKIYIKLYNYA